MSLARRLFLARRPKVSRVGAAHTAASHAPVAVMDPALLDWDDEERQTALDEARELAEADPEAAEQLRAQVEASLRYDGQRAGPVLGQVEQYASVSRQASGAFYDPVELYEFAMKYWRQPLSEIKRMDYREFFAYIRQAVLRMEAEQAETDRIKRGHYTAAPTQVVESGAAPGQETYQKLHPWEGEVVPYGA